MVKLFLYWIDLTCHTRQNRVNFDYIYFKKQILRCCMGYTTSGKFPSKDNASFIMIFWKKYIVTSKFFAPFGRMQVCRLWGRRRLVEKVGVLIEKISNSGIGAIKNINPSPNTTHLRCSTGIYEN